MVPQRIKLGVEAKIMNRIPGGNREHILDLVQGSIVLSHPRVDHGQVPYAVWPRDGVLRDGGELHTPPALADCVVLAAKAGIDESERTVEAMVTRTKTKSPQTNGICERFHKTALDEFYRLAFRKKIYTTIEGLQKDLDEWFEEYNTRRPHQGKRCERRTPYATMHDGKAIVEDKRIAA